MLTELLRSTPWWVWLIVVAGFGLVLTLSVALPTLVIAKSTRKGSRERAFVHQLGVVAAVAVSVFTFVTLMDPSRQTEYSALFLIGLCLACPWAYKRQKTIRESEAKKTSNHPSQPIAGKPGSG
jgi:hypothetical protein